MRTTPIVGKKLWFGPRRFGWGWTPVSWEGWAALFVIVALIVVPAAAMSSTFGTADGALYSLLVIAVIVVTCSLKGTPPGGPAAWRALHRPDEPRDEPAT